SLWVADLAPQAQPILFVPGSGKPEAYRYVLRQRRIGCQPNYLWYLPDLSLFDVRLRNDDPCVFWPRRRWAGGFDGFIRNYKTARDHKALADRLFLCGTFDLPGIRRPRAIVARR